MSDLIGRFLSFEEHLGKGLVRVTYYVALFFLVVTSLYYLLHHLFSGEFGSFLLVPFDFLIKLLILRVGAEFVMAVLSIDDSLQGEKGEGEGFAAGLTPSTTMGATTRPESKPSTMATSSEPSTPEAEPSIEPTGTPSETTSGGGETGEGAEDEKPSA